MSVGRAFGSQTLGRFLHRRMIIVSEHRAIESCNRADLLFSGLPSIPESYDESAILSRSFGALFLFSRESCHHTIIL